MPTHLVKVYKGTMLIAEIPEETGEYPTSFGKLQIDFANVQGQSPCSPRRVTFGGLVEASVDLNWEGTGVQTLRGGETLKVVLGRKFDKPASRKRNGRDLLYW